MALRGVLAPESRHAIREHQTAMCRSHGQESQQSTDLVALARVGVNQVRYRVSCWSSTSAPCRTSWTSTAYFYEAVPRVQLRRLVWLSMPMHVGLVNFWGCQRCSFGLGLPPLFGRPQYLSRDLAFGFSLTASSPSPLSSRSRRFLLQQSSWLPRVICLSRLLALLLLRRYLHEGHLGSHCNNEGTTCPAVTTMTTRRKTSQSCLNTLTLRK